MLLPGVDGRVCGRPLQTGIAGVIVTQIAFDDSRVCTGGSDAHALDPRMAPDCDCALGRHRQTRFDVPIRQSFFVHMVGKEDLPNAIALNSSIFNGARMVGPAIAGFCHRSAWRRLVLFSEWSEFLLPCWWRC